MFVYENTVCFPTFVEMSLCHWEGNIYSVYECVFLIVCYLIVKKDKINKESFRQTKYLCVLIHIRIKGEVGAVKPV